MASQRKPHVFRVTGLSRGLPDGDLQTALQETLNDNFTADERSQIKTEITIVPSCYESDTQRVALVRFRGGLPRFLTELTTNSLGDWQVEMRDQDINFDSHFFGFTQLYAPDEKEPVIADIIAIAGLDGHAYESWQGRGNLGRMWLRDFLSKDLPQCRTMIYGYNSKLSSHGVDTILDYGRVLMEEIKKIRNTKELQQRPLFFIAHSFGGIILAHCLVRAISTMEEDHPAITSLHRATHGMFLFAIPHKGLVMDDIQQMLAGDKPHLREQLLQQISRTLDLLVYLLADFKNLIRDRNVVSFYETEQTRQLVFNSGSSQWERTGKVITTVDTNSAILQLPDYVKDKVPLHADHSMIVKFDTRNAVGYQIALNKLRQFVEDTPQVVGDSVYAGVSSLQPRSTVPFDKDPMFVGREAVISAIKEIHGAIGQHHQRVALVGLAGVGKTQTAIEYTYRVRESTPGTWVFWIHASNAARLEQGFQDIAAVAEIPTRDEPKINIPQLVYQWLCDPRNGRWLMVLDNADDDSIFFSSNKPNERGPLVGFLPQAAHGSILITSRNGIAARNLVGSEGHVIAVQPMNEEESLALLRARIPGPQSGEDEKALVQALEYIPLAITQAGSYIANRSPRVTVSRYLQLFYESESNQTYLLQHQEAKDLRRDPSIRHAIITTWQLSFEQIRHDEPAATDLLALMSMFDRRGIPESLVRANGDWLQFEDAVRPLIGYSLVRFEIETASFDMHRLVQLSVRRWLEIHLELTRWQKKSRAIMAQMFPNGQYENWTECQRLLPHAKEVMKPISDDQEDRLHVATISFHCGWYLRLRGTYEEAEAMHRRALEEREKVLGREHPDTLASVDNLGVVLFSQGKYEKAEVMHQQALEVLEKVLGHEHPNTLASVSNLGLVLSRQGKSRKAEAMHRRALEAQEKVLGHKHPGTLTSIDNLGLVLSNQGKYEEAEAMHRRALEAREKVLGYKHPDTLASVNNLSLVLSRQGKYEEAEATNQRAIEARRKVLGYKHPDTIASVNNLGLVLSRQGKYEEAEAMHRWALEAREKVLGREHPSTLASVNNLGLVLSSQGKSKEAEAMHRWALETREKVLGLEHPDTLASVNNLSLVLSRQGRYKEAEAMHQRVLEAQEKVLECEYPDTLVSVNNLGLVLSSQGKSEEAEASSPSDLPAFQRAATITTTSQYVSDRIFPAEQMSSLETQTSLPSELEDVQTVYSGTFTMKGSLKEIYIDELVRELVKSISSFQKTPLAVRRVAEVMPDCLKAFSLRLGSGKSFQQDHLDVTAFIRKYRQDISDAFTKAALNDSSVNAAAGDSSPNETISWETRARANMPLHDIMTHWLRYEVQDMNDNAWSPGDFNLHPIEDKDKDRDVETNSGAQTDEALGPVMPELKRYRECIFGNPAYEWLLRDLQKHCDLVPSSPDLSSEIRKAILQALPSQTTFTRQEPSSSYKMTYNMDWDLVSFLNEQEYSEESYQALPLVITVTGSREAAQALTCSQYLHQTWPSSAAGILGLLQTLLIPEEKNKATGDLQDGTKLAAWLYFSERWRVYRVAVEVIGSTYSVIEVGELLAWLGSALQLSPYPDQIAYCRPRVSQFQTIRRSHGKEEPQYAAEGSAEIEFTIDKKGQSPSISGECWHGLFRNCVVVEGYPISRRPEEGAINGLEIPLGMMASLAQAKYVNNFLGVPILKGFSAMLVPTDVNDEIVSWHLVHNKNGDRISYLDSGVTPARGLMAGRLSQTRHILGWCSDAKYLAGTKDAKYEVGGSRLPKPRENDIFGQMFISSGQIITGGAPFLVGYKDTPFHVSRAGYIRKLKWIIQKSVVLWDEETKRGWLLNAASALLHLVRASIMHDSTGPLSSECLFQWDKLEEAPADTAHVPGSAIKVLLNHNNRALTIYEGKNDLVKFEDRVEHFLNMLEQIFDYEVYAVGPDGDGYNSKSIPRAHFEGWDFHDLATESDPLYPRLANMAPKGKAWIDFTRSIHAINLLGSDFGEILEPLNSSCPHWASLPKDQYYLAAGIADLRMIVEYTGDLTANPIRLNENLVWHNPERIFDFCGCVDATASHTDIVQVILPATLSDSAECNSSIDLQHIGAVVFGYCRDFQWQWGDSGDPKKDDIRADDAHLSAKYDLGQEHNTTSSIGSKSDYASLSSSDDPSVEDTIQTSSVENEPTKPKSLSRSYTRWNLETLRAEDYAVGIVCALPLELLAVRALFDQTHPDVQFSAADSNHYALGRWGRHRVVAACLPDGEYGTNSAADVASNLKRSFPSVKFCFMVGIGGGVPSSRNDIRLGDVVVSKPIGINPGVIQYDMGKALENGVFEQNGVLHAPPRLIMTALSSLKSDPYLSENPLQEYIDEIGACRKEYRYPGSHRDRLFSSRYLHNSKHVTCDRCSDAHVIVRPVRSNPYPRIHYGLVASGNSVIKDAILRDKWSAEKNVLCFEMEAAGVMNILPCLVIRGICDYSDSHKNKSFQEYAAATAASYAKLLLSYIKDSSDIDGMALRSIKDDQSFFGAFRRALTLFPMHGI